MYLIAVLQRLFHDGISYLGYITKINKKKCNVSFIILGSLKPYKYYSDGREVFVFIGFHVGVLFSCFIIYLRPLGLQNVKNKNKRISWK